MNNQDIHSPRPSKLHKRSSSSPDALNKSLQPPPPSPHRRRLIKRNSGSSHHHNQQQHHQKMDPGPLTIPPAPTSSDLSVDKELLQRWSARESPHGTPSHRPSSYTKRHASFDSPREVPLPSPGNLPPLSSPLYPVLSSGATPSVNPASPGRFASSSRVQESTEYFPTLFSPSKADSSPSSSGSSSQSSKQSSRVSFPKRHAVLGGHYPVFEDEELQGQGYARGDSDLSDWTRETSPATSLVMGESTQVQKQHSDQQSTTGSDLTHRSPLPSEAADANSALGSSTMTPSTRPSNTPEGSHSYSTIAGTGMRAAAAGTPIYPFSRPYSFPDAQPHSSDTMTRSSRTSSMTSNLSDSSNGACSSVAPTSATPESPPSWPARNSSASLPLPSQIPFHILPTVERSGPGFPGTSDVEASEYLSDSCESGVGARSRADTRDRYPNNPYQHKHLQTSGSQQHLDRDDEKDNESIAPPAVPGLPAESGPDNVSAGGPFPGQQAESEASSPTHSHSLSQTSQPQSHSSPQPQQTHSHRPPSAPSRRSVSPFRAPQPRPEPSGSTSTAYTALASYPAPEPPMILAPTSDMPHRAYEPFLSHAPPPADSWIEVQTTSGEYRLNVRLPGFRRDGITLATKRRRILHVVADSWDNEGGHFERRISFGYDADLAQVRAEFDGEMLTISIPRRLPPAVNFWQSGRSS